MTPNRLVALAIAIALFASDAPAQSFLEKLNRGLEKVNGVLSGSTSAPAAGPAMPQTTDRQVALLMTALQAQGKPLEVVTMADEARKVVGEVLLLSSCYPGYDVGRQLGRYAAPDAMAELFLSPMGGLTYHPKAQCLTVQRVDGWQARAKNAFGFRGVYVSEASGESKSLHYEFVKQPDGAWLLRRAGF